MKELHHRRRPHRRQIDLDRGGGGKAQCSTRYVAVMHQRPNAGAITLECGVVVAGVTTWGQIVLPWDLTDQADLDAAFALHSQLSDAGTVTLDGGPWPTMAVRLRFPVKTNGGSTISDVRFRHLDADGVLLPNTLEGDLLVRPYVTVTRCCG